MVWTFLYNLSKTSLDLNVRKFTKWLWLLDKWNDKTILKGMSFKICLLTRGPFSLTFALSLSVFVSLYLCSVSVSLSLFPSFKFYLSLYLSFFFPVAFPLSLFISSTFSSFSFISPCFIYLYLTYLSFEPLPLFVGSSHLYWIYGVFLFVKQFLGTYALHIFQYFTGT